MRGRWLFASLLVVASCSTASIAVVGGSDEDAGDAPPLAYATSPDATPRCTMDPALTQAKCGYDPSLLSECRIDRAVVSCTSSGGSAICLSDGKLDCYGRPLVDGRCADECCPNEYGAACAGELPVGCRSMGALPAGFQFVCCTCAYGADAAPPETADRCSSEWTTPPPACSFDASITSGITDEAGACRVERMAMHCAPDVPLASSGDDPRESWQPRSKPPADCYSDGSTDCYGGEPFAADAGYSCKSTCCPNEYLVTCSGPGEARTPPGCRRMSLIGGGGGTFCCPCRWI